MGFRMRKSFSPVKGVRINMSKSGVGVSAGAKGFRAGVGPRGTRVNVGIPGTGVGYEKQWSNKKSRSADGSKAGCLWLVMLLVIPAAMILV